MNVKMMFFLSDGQHRIVKGAAAQTNSSLYPQLTGKEISDLLWLVPEDQYIALSHRGASPQPSITFLYCF